MTGTGPALKTEEKYEMLSHLYLMLWKQLDILQGETKWLDSVPADPDDLKQAAQQALDAVAPFLKGGDLWAVVSRDYNTAQRLTADPRSESPSRMESIKDYLRDQALRFAEESEPLDRS
jgi:hypothetical protein